MTKPTHMYIEFDNEKNIFTAHYGRMNPIMEYIPDKGGVVTEHFKHPKKGFVYYFKQIGEPEMHRLDGKPIKSVRNHIKNYARNKKINIVKPEDIFSHEELFFCKVEMCTARTTEPPGGLYSTNIATCMGISLYNSETKYTHLFHTPGCDEEMMPLIFGHLDNRLLEQETKMNNIEVNIASGLVTLGDEEVVEIISEARDGLLEYFFSKNINPKIHFAENRGESIRYMSINPNNGFVEAIKEHVAY